MQYIEVRWSTDGRNDHSKTGNQIMMAHFSEQILEKKNIPMHSVE